MSEGNRDLPKTPSFGGDTADFLGSLKALETGQPYKDSLNPLGNPFEGKTVEGMVEQFFSMHSNISDLEILKGRVDDFYGVKSDTASSEKLSEQYINAQLAIDKILQEKK